MNKAFYLNLFKSLAVASAKSYGAKKLRQMAVNPERNFHVSWRMAKFSANAWIGEDVMPPKGAPIGSKKLVSVTVDGERFGVWWAKA